MTIRNGICSCIFGLVLALAGWVQAQSDTAHLVLTGETKDAKLGAYVARVPDVTGDGVDEIVSGNHRWDGPGGVDCGRVLLFNGANGKTLWTFNGDKAGGLLGHDVWGIEDLNGDGRGDVIASAYRYPFSGRPNAGKVWVLSGKDGSVLWYKDGQNTGDEFGYALGSVPDIDGDKIPEVIVGAWLNDDLANLAGKVYIFSGKKGDIIRNQDGYAKENRFGCSCAGFHDLDGDGHGDYVIGALHAGPNREGEAYLFSGKTGKRIRTWTGEKPTDLFGWSVATVPDTDGDSHDDLYVGARDFDTNGGLTVDAGRAYLFSAKTGKRLHTFDGEKAWDKFGRFGAGVPDVDGDGRGEVAVGAYYHHANGVFRSGAAYLFSGSTGKRLAKYHGEEKDNMFGFALCGLNDVNGDGRGDVVVGAYQYRPNAGLTESYGRIYVYTKGLSSTATTLSAGAGGMVPLHIDVGTVPGPRVYMVAASMSGNHPGFPLTGNLHVPINFDIFTMASWIYANSPILIKSFDKTDAKGKATAYFRVPAGMLAGYVGMKLTFVWVLVDRMDKVSNPHAVEIKP